MSDQLNNYNFFSRLFHHLVLGNSLVKRTAFDLECFSNKNRPGNPNIDRPVYISGLPRSGTTILLNILYSSGEFNSLTYRDMPFVTAPGLWKRMPFSSGHESGLRERAHGDDLLIGYDSPEALEEVFWVTFLGKDYIKKECLDIQTSCPQQIEESYKKFVSNAILTPRKEVKTDAPRYLAKNNNNLLRIDLLKRVFPQSVIIVPFRDPIDHASSLLKQHLRFLEIHKNDTFVLKYMNWLGHFDFGLNFKPHNTGKLFSLEPSDPENLNYWLGYWTRVYEYIFKQHRDKILFLDYEELCRHPEDVLLRLEKKAMLGQGALVKSASSLRLSPKYRRKTVEEGPLKTAERLYKTLKERAL